MLRLLETIRRLGAKLIAITGDTTSTLAQAADVGARLQRHRGSVSAEPRADREHHSRAGDWRRAGDDAAASKRGSGRRISRAFTPAASSASA